MSAPRVSVVIRCYRHAHYLPEAVASVVAQTFGDWEVVVLDDGSPDDTPAVAAALAAGHPGHAIRHVRQENAGPPRALEAGIAAARAELVLALDADDRLHPTFLEKTVAVLDRDPGASVAFTDVVRFGAACAGWRMGPFTVEALKEKNRLCVTSLLRRRLWSEVGGFRPEMELGYEDWDFWLSCAVRGARAVHVRQPLFFYRVHDAHGSTDAVAGRHHEQLVATMVLHHPDVYGAKAVAWARALLEARPLPSRESLRGAG